MIPVPFQNILEFHRLGRAILDNQNFNAILFDSIHHDLRFNPGRVESEIMMNTIEENSIEILIVENSSTQAMKLQYILERHGYHVSIARNGQDALQSIRKQKPTMVISAVVMSGMDGYELCTRIKGDDALKDIPVVLLTSLADPQDIIRGMESGANNFIVKPYEEKFLLSRIRYILANQELRKI